MTTFTQKSTTHHNDAFDKITSLVDPYLNSNQKKQFLLSLNDNKTYSFIVNKSRIVNLDSLNLIPSNHKSKIDEITYYHNEIALGNNLLNKTGAIYMIDASSSIIAYYLKDLVINSGLVLDLCAAPGGKSISLSLYRNDLLFLCNDVSFSRAVEMNKNFNRLGLKNMISLSTRVKEIEKLDSIFDLIILDAPCSGSGMIRKEKKMINDYSYNKVNNNVLIQEELLSSADKLLKNNGLLLYSTCSFNVKENEEQIQKFISKHNYEIVKLNVDSSIIQTNYGYHLIPGIFQGEGIFFCLLRKKEKTNSPSLTNLKLNKIDDIETITYKNKSYAITRLYKEFLSLPLFSLGIKVFDDDKYSKTKYTHEFNILIKDKYQKISLPLNDAIKYLNGEKLSFNSSLKDGIYFLEYNQIPLGLGNKKGNNIQNLLPKRLK